MDPINPVPNPAVPGGATAPDAGPDAQNQAQAAQEDGASVQPEAQGAPQTGQQVSPAVKTQIATPPPLRSKIEQIENSVRKRLQEDTERKKRDEIRAWRAGGEGAYDTQFKRERDNLVAEEQGAAGPSAQEITVKAEANVFRPLLEEKAVEKKEARENRPERSDKPS